MIHLGHSFNAKHTFECGQCFRWNISGDFYTGVAGGRICQVRISDNTVLCPDKDNEFWRDYFSEYTDYDAIIKSLIEKDSNMEKCTDFGHGIRILHQDIFETIISFIISANNNIPRIKKIIETLCRKFGERITPPKECAEVCGEYYAFPTPEVLAMADISDLSELRAGYRDKYILHAARAITSGEVNIHTISEKDTPDAKKELMKIKGVGGKVADCILLFSMRRYETFPKDVWILRILNRVYGIPENTKPRELDKYIAEKYGSLAGFAQQYMYYYYRENNV